MSEEVEVTRSGGTISALTLTSRVLGMIRDIVIARAFGAGIVADAFFVAFSIPNMLRRMLGEGSLTISFVPVFTEELETKPRDEAMKLAYSTFWLALIILLVITALGMILAPWITRLLAPGFISIPEKIALAEKMTRQLFPYTLLICLVALAMGVLNSFKHFVMPSASPIFLNISLIASVLIINHRFQFWHPGFALVIGVLAGGVVQFLAQVPVLIRYGFTFKPILELNHPGLRKIWRLMLPSIFGASIYQINLLIATIFVSPFEGGRSYIYYADRLVQLPLAIFAIALATAILPSLSQFASQKQWQEFERLVNFGLRLVGFLIIPSMLGLILLRIPIISLIYQHGTFSAQDTQSTAFALLFYGLALWAGAGVRIMASGYYSLQDAKTPVWCGFIAMLVNLLGCIFLTRISYLGFAGVALATALATIINFLLLVLLFSKKPISFHFQMILKTAGKSLIACLPLILISLYLSRFSLWLDPGRILEKLLWLLGGVIISAGVYFLLARVLKMEELETLKQILRRK